MVGDCFIGKDIGLVGRGQMSDRMMLVYAGKGSSHSWTWLADLFESAGIADVRFPDSKGFTEGLDPSVSKVLVSGGDGMMIADSIGSHGFAHLKGFIHRGGGYIGICAGAYLPLHSSIPPLDQFNISTTKIENIDCTTPTPGTSPRVAVNYGSCSIIHPVRGEVTIANDNAQLIAPIYGGPIFMEPDRDRVLFRYSGFTSSTEFQMDAPRTRELVIGRPAVIESVHGKGRLLLLGPHLEHPKYRDANKAFLELTEGTDHGIREGVPKAEGEPAASLVRSISNLRIAVLGLENRAFLVGNKLWDGSRFLELIAAIEKRSGFMDNRLADDIAHDLTQVRDYLVRSPSGAGDDSLEGPDLLVEAARKCIDGHFALMRNSR